jgi:hypothetical protein
VGRRAATVALVAGLAGLLAGPILVADAQARYLVLTCDVLALAAGVLALRADRGGSARLDYALAGMITAGVSLFLWISWMSDPPQGST